MSNNISNADPKTLRAKLGALDPLGTALFVCDIQEKFKPVMLNFDTVVENAKKLVSGCNTLEVPIVVSEQYPKGLGKTVEGLNLDACTVAMKFEKTQFHMITTEVEKAMPTLTKEKLTTVVLCGIETHVCVEQTAIELLSRGYAVHIVSDCVTSRTAHDRAAALTRLTQMGCFVSTYESVLFKLLGGKDHQHFKEISRLVREPSKDPSLLSNL